MKQALVVAPIPPLGIEKLERVAAVLHALKRRHDRGVLRRAARRPPRAAARRPAARVGAALQQGREAKRGAPRRLRARGVLGAGRAQQVREQRAVPRTCNCALNFSRHNALLLCFNKKNASDVTLT